jgi:hypothetical protein
MSLEKIIAAAIEGDAVEVNKSFNEEISSRISLALEEKYKAAMEEDLEEAKDDDEDEDEDEDDEDQKDDDDEDDDEDED